MYAHFPSNCSHNIIEEQIVSSLWDSSSCVVLWSADWIPNLQTPWDIIFFDSWYFNVDQLCSVCVWNTIESPYFLGNVSLFIISSTLLHLWMYLFCLSASFTFLSLTYRSIIFFILLSFLLSSPNHTFFYLSTGRGIFYFIFFMTLSE